LGIFIADHATFDADFLNSVWIAAIPGFVGATAISYLARRDWRIAYGPRLVVLHACRRFHPSPLFPARLVYAAGRCRGQSVKALPLQRWATESRRQRLPASYSFRFVEVIAPAD
jgi:hypothetical protein